ncbi:MAG: hypothetical protein U0441_28120 [Polyangiaceae bacterium]
MNNMHSMRIAAALGLLSAGLVSSSARADGPAAPQPPVNGAPPTATFQPPVNGAPPTATFQPPALGAPVPVVYPGPGAVDPMAAAHARAPAVEQWRSRRKYLVSGSIILGIGYYLTLIPSAFGASRNNRGSKDYFAGFVPVVGPFVAGVLRAVPDGGPTPTADYAGMAAYFGLGAVQAVGAALLFKGWRMAPGLPYDPCMDSESLASDSPGRRPCSRFSATVAPIVTPTFTGAGLTGTF